MGRLRPLSGREVCALLQRLGFQPVRQKGSHIVMQHHDGTSTVTVPVPNHAELKAETLRSSSGNPVLIGANLSSTEHRLA